tara:strand:- start:2334 stop:2918 length:585 start_codon:yes stop_codon:yes gene_type:complete
LKIYFDGCSYTRGSPRWGVDNWEERRWSKLLANKLDAEEYNFSCGGGSNPRILRNITTKHDISDYDLVVILMTRPNRTEYFYNGKFRNVLSTKKFEDPKIAQFWNFYYKTIYDEQYGDTYEETIQKSIKAICEVNKVPLVLMSNWEKTKLSFDMMVHCDIYGRTSPTDKHPGLDAQPKIADDIYNFINKYKRFY